MWLECCYHHSSLLTWGAENLLVWELNCYCTTGWCSMGELGGAATFTSLTPCKLHLWAIQRHRRLYLRNHKHPTVSHMSFRIMSGTNKSDTYLPFGHNNSGDKTWEWGGLLQHKENSSQQTFLWQILLWPWMYASQVCNPMMQWYGSTFLFSHNFYLYFYHKWL